MNDVMWKLYTAKMWIDEALGEMQVSKEQLGKAKERINDVLAELQVSDEEHLPVKWEMGRDYNKGDIVTFDGGKFRSLQDHSSRLASSPAGGPDSKHYWRETNADEALDRASQEAALDRFEGIAKGQSPNPLTIMEIREIVRNELLKVDDKPDIDHAEFFDNKVAVNTLKRLVRHEIEKAAKAEGDE